MCGIVGYVGGNPAVEYLLDGLKRLEYRGYDSAGIAVLNGGPSIDIVKSVGRISRLEERLNGMKTYPGNLGIGHTRWATHGKPSDENAHPHGGCDGRFALVHNGIIENFAPLKESLIRAGHVFKSETDTEVITHLIEDYYEGDLFGALLKVVPLLKGSFAIGVIGREEPDKIVALRQYSPLVIGLGEHENYVASDIPAVLRYTRKVHILDDGEVAVVKKGSARIYDLDGKSRSKDVFWVKWDPVAAEKGGYKHFMLKEIHEQPKAIRDTLTGRLVKEDAAVNLGLDEAMLKGVQRIHCVACGTAYHAGVVGKYMIEKVARTPVEADLASEFRYRDPIVSSDDLFVAISQSGETADTLAAIREAKRKDCRVMAITNVVGSSVSREADQVLYTWAGPEIAVASTKAYVTQVISLLLLAINLGKVKGTVSQEWLRKVTAAVEELPSMAEKVLSQDDFISSVAHQCAAKDDVFFIGRGLDYAVAMEGQLKLKEISYIHAEAYAAGELKHGTLALITAGTPVIAVVTQDDIKEKTISNIIEVKARGATVISVCQEGDEEVARVSDVCIPLPKTLPLLYPALAVIPLQLLAYYAAVARGTDVDHPRNLAKSVTVE